MMLLNEFHFIRPHWLWAIIPCLLLAVVIFRNKLKQGNWSAVCDAELLPYLIQAKTTKPSRFAITTGTLAALVAIFALAGPTWERLPTPIFRNESALVIILDLSLSMDAQDIKPSRLIRARFKIADILKQRKDGQTALIVYAGDAFVVTPLTDDSATIESQLAALTTDIMPEEGSNTPLALKKAFSLLQQAGLQQGQVLLVTDNVDTDLAVHAVNKLGGYNLSILGVGTPEGAPISLPEGGFLKDKDGSIMMPKLNIADLAQLAHTGNGVYWTISDDDTDVKALLAAITKPVVQQGAASKSLLADLWDDKGPALALLVLPLAALSFRKGLLCWALLVLLPLPKNSYALDWQTLWQTKDQLAQQAYTQQKYEQAANLFENPDWKAIAQFRAGHYQQTIDTLKNNQPSALSAYNQGNAYAQSGQLPEAINAYQQALSLNPNDEDAKYNKALVEKELEKQKKDQQKQPGGSGSQKDQPPKPEPQQPQDKPSEPPNDPGQKQEQSNPSEDQPDPAQENHPEDPKPDAKPKPEPEQKDPSKKDQPQTDKPQAAEPQKTAGDDKESATPAEAKPTAEKLQADENWLNRIPDDPAGLLRRKFELQHQRRQN